MIALRFRSVTRLNAPYYAAVVVLVALFCSVLVAFLPFEITVVLFIGTAIAIGILLEPLSGIVVLLAVAPLKTLIETETPYLSTLDIGQITLLVFVGLWGLNRITRRWAIVLPLSMVQVPVLLFVVAASVSILNAGSLSFGLSELLKWIEMLGLVSIVVTITPTVIQAQWLVFAVVFAGSIQATLGLYEFFGGSGAAYLWILDNRFFRAFGSFGQPNPFGGFMGITLALALGSLWGYWLEIWQRLRPGILRWHQLLLVQEGRSLLFAVFSYGVMALLIGGGLVASWSRGAWLGFAIASAVMLAFIPRRMPVRMLLMSGVLIGAVLLWSSNLVPDAVIQRMGGFVEELTTVEDVRGVDITDSNYAVVERIAHWQAAVDMAEEHPWLGIGFGNYEPAYAQYALLNWPLPLGHAHNYYLNLLAETGLIGLAAYLLMWASIYWITLRSYHRYKGVQRGWLIGLLGVWTYIMVHSLLDKLYVNNLFLHIGCLLGVLAVLVRSQYQQQKSR